jgi:hypothetical protein
MTSGGSFQAILDVLIPYDIYSISMAKLGFNEGEE